MTASSSSSKLGLVSQQVAGLVPSLGRGVVGVGGGGAAASGSFQAAVKRLGLVPNVDQLSLSEPNTPGKYRPIGKQRSASRHLIGGRQQLGLVRAQHASQVLTDQKENNAL
jgi:hypothetical protein